MARLILALIVALASAAPVPALQKFEEYRIMGSEILSVRMGPQEIEAPSTLIIGLAPGSAENPELVIESDDDLTDCLLAIEHAIGYTNRYIQIRVHLTVDTMNGVLVTECATISIPND